MASNYPPGHPTGVSRGEESEIFYCERCNYLLDVTQLQVRDNPLPVTYICPECKKADMLQRACCERCERPATHIDTERDTNANMAFCSEHGG